MFTHYFMQNDLVHGWGLDFALRKCVEVIPAIIMHNTSPPHLLPIKGLAKQFMPFLSIEHSSINSSMIANLINVLSSLDALHVILNWDSFTSC